MVFWCLLGLLVSAWVRWEWGGAGVGAAQDSGGWVRAEHSDLASLPCTLEHQPATLTAERFASEFRHKKPVVLGAGLLEQWHAQQNWRKASLLSLYGNATAKMGSSAELVFSAGDDSVRPVPLAEA